MYWVLMRDRILTRRKIMDEIRRYLSENRFDNFKKDIANGRNPLINTIKNLGEELDLQFRPKNKLNIYYRRVSETMSQLRD